jgi:hypothetical protein
MGHLTLQKIEQVSKLPLLKYFMIRDIRSGYEQAWLYRVEK